MECTGGNIARVVLWSESVATSATLCPVEIEVLIICAVFSEVSRVQQQVGSGQIRDTLTVQAMRVAEVENAQSLRLEVLRLSALKSISLAHNVIQICKLQDVSLSCIHVLQRF